MSQSSRRCGRLQCGRCYTELGNCCGHCKIRELEHQKPGSLVASATERRLRAEAEIRADAEQQKVQLQADVDDAHDLAATKPTFVDPKICARLGIKTPE